jgi:putative peptidoglycan lipid II flippase
VHPTDVDPGVTLAGRYRVAELIAETPGDGGVAQTWRAVDEVLSRSVVVYVLSADDPRTEAVLEASRKAATATDVRFLRVLDAMCDDGVAYVVREWVPGRSLGTILADGPLPPHQAGLLVREVAEAMARAHEQDLTHQRLDPDSIVITDSGALKIVGLGTHAALTAGRNGGSDADPKRLDCIGLGRLLYAGLTAKWPTGPRSGLPAAPRAADGSLLSPRQCRAGVPRPLDDITERILLENPRSGPPLTSPREIVTALTDVVGVTPLEGILPAHGVGDYYDGRSRHITEDTQVGGRPVFDPPEQAHASEPPARRTGELDGPPAGSAYGRGYQPIHEGGEPVPGGPQGDRYGPRHSYQPAYRPPRPPSGSRWRRGAAVVIGMLFLAGIGLLGWELMTQAFHPVPSGEPTTPAPKQTASPSKPTPGVKLQVVDARDFDPQPGGNGEEHPDEVGEAYDGDPETAWRTMLYEDDPLTIYKPGVGIWFDLGKVQSIGQVELRLIKEGHDFQLMVAPQDASGPPATVDGWDPVASVKGADASVTVKPKREVSSRYVLVWMTRLPPDTEEPSRYRGGIAEIVVRQ